MTTPSPSPSHGNWRPLKAVLGGLVDVPDSFEVSDITQDSRDVTPGAAFLACSGRTHHGLQFADSAIAAGARAILWEPAPGVSAPAAPAEVLVCAVPELGHRVGLIADRFFGAPSASMKVTGVTGTNGKTTCAWLLSQALGRSGRRAGYIGTLGVAMPAVGAPESAPAQLRPLQHTTPDAVTGQRLLAQMKAAGVECVALEASSHALDQGRLAGVRFHVAAFTNLTRDHLDYHGSMEAYTVAKAQLLDWPTLAVRVINIDDPTGAQLARERLHAGASRLIVTSAQGALQSENAPDFRWREQAREYVFATAARTSTAGLEIEIETTLGSARLSSALRGHFNVDNLLTVLGMLLAHDIPLSEACAALARCTAPPGRMQVEGGGTLPLVLVDYAHTPDALAKVLAAAREHCRGVLWCVFGCGGERDRGKRAEMGRVAATLADVLLVTDDNPRGEEPEAITTQIMRGIEAAGAGGRTRVLHDRARAIGSALEEAAVADVVVVAGKGHENYQIIGTERRCFSDALVVRSALAARSAA